MQNRVSSRLLFVCRALCVFGLATASIACDPPVPAGPGAGVTDAGSDAGTVQADAGVAVDAGVVDAGVEDDAGVVLDAGGTDADAGATPDAGVVVDAGAPDAGGADADAGSTMPDAGIATPDAGSAMDAGAADAGPQVDGCTTDMDCTGGRVCTVVKTADDRLVRACAAPEGAADTGALCANDAACASGLCHAGLCTAPCATDTDCPDGSTCALTALSHDGVDRALPLCVPADQTCTSDPDCAASARTCTDLRNTPDGLVFYCAAPPSGSGMLGDGCASPYLDTPDQCATGLCDDDAAGACTKLCTTDAECGLPGWVCAGSGSSNLSDVRICAQGCDKQADCGTGRSCVRKSNPVSGLTDRVCDGNRGTAATGATVMAANECMTGLTRLVGGSAANQYCTEFCVTDADCPAAAPDCSTVTAGAETFDLCRRVP